MRRGRSSAIAPGGARGRACPVRADHRDFRSIGCNTSTNRRLDNTTLDSENLLSAPKGQDSCRNSALARHVAKSSTFAKDACNGERHISRGRATRHRKSSPLGRCNRPCPFCVSGDHRPHRDVLICFDSRIGLVGARSCRAARLEAAPIRRLSSRSRVQQQRAEFRKINCAGHNQQNCPNPSRSAVLLWRGKATRGRYRPNFSRSASMRLEASALLRPSA